MIPLAAMSGRAGGATFAGELRFERPGREILVHWNTA